MWETLTNRLRRRGYPVLMERPVTKICHNGSGVTQLETRGPNAVERFPGTHLISAMPIRVLVGAIDPPAPEEVARAARQCQYLDFLIDSSIIKRKDGMPDTR